MIYNCTAEAGMPPDLPRLIPAYQEMERMNCLACYFYLRRSICSTNSYRSATVYQCRNSGWHSVRMEMLTATDTRV
ncbi:hypothetical protein GJ744_006159 [Endocarpon pusillum]|uniref:Uncharacterized protein n=1 Tax=Endocarpon pusillum TaxID=364733 RepID=A0A8H7A859_9EURO|nr:hypothetical protein GJ744_006159 [Endocarpon pusillum]